MQAKINKIWFYENFFDDKNILLFNAKKWYEVIFHGKNDIIYLFAENGEKIGIDTNENPNLFCVQKIYKQ